MSAVLRKTTASCVTVHFRNICFGRGSFIHASQALRPEKRGSPLPIGRTGTDFIPLSLHCVRTRPAGKEVRLRLDFFDARFVLSGSVLHFAPDTSSEGERKRKTVTAGVPLLSTPSLSDSQSGIATLSLRSLLCRAYTLQGLQFLRCGCGIKPWLLLLAARQIQNRVLICSRSLRRFPPTAPSPFWSRLRSRLQSLRLHSVTQAPSAGPALTPEGCCHSTLIQPYVPEPERPSSLASIVVPSGSCRACRLACSLPGRQKERCSRIALSDFLRVEREDIRTLQWQCSTVE